MPFNQAQREALIDALVLSMFADSHTRPEEKSFIEAHEELADWASSEPLYDYYIASSERAVNFIREANHLKQFQYIEHIAVRLSSAEHKALVLEECLKLLQADGELSEDEEAFASMLAMKL